MVERIPWRSIGLLLAGVLFLAFAILDVRIRGRFGGWEWIRELFGPEVSRLLLGFVGFLCFVLVYLSLR